MENKNSIEQAKLEPLEKIFNQRIEYEKGLIELGKSYMGHIITISALFVGFLPYFIKDINIDCILLNIITIGEIFFIFVIVLILRIYQKSIKHQEYNVNGAINLYNIIAEGSKVEDITNGIKELGQDSEKKNNSVRSKIGILSTITNILFILGILLVFVPILISLYK